MSGVFPMSVERVLSVNNLPANMRTNSIWSEQHTVALERLQKYVKSDFWLKLTTGEGDFTPGQVTSGEVAGGLFTYVQAMPLMNLNSIGKGFVVKTGIEENSTEILKHDELTKYRNSLEEMALSGIKDFLNTVGLERLRLVSAKKKSKYRVGIIGDIEDV